MWDTWLWLSLCYSWFFTCCCTSACFCHPIHHSHLICCHCSIFGGNPTYCQYLLHPPNFTQNYLPIFQNPNKTAPISWEVLLLLSLTNTLENDVGIFWRKVSLPTRWRDLRGIHPPKPQAGRRGCRREERKRLWIRRSIPLPTGLAFDGWGLWNLRTRPTLWRTSG